MSTILDYRVKPTRLLVGGGWDASRYLDSYDINTPEPEVGQAITYTGQFEVSLNTSAEADGLTPDDFSPYIHPERWRPDRAVTIELTNSFGVTAKIALRIQKYTWDKVTNKGRGTLQQLIDVVDRSRPSSTIETVLGGGGTLLSTIVPALVTDSFKDCAIAPSAVIIPGVTGVIDDKVSTRNPISDANRLLSSNWRWFTVNRNEAFVAISGDPIDHPVLFSRHIRQYESVPDLENINSWLSTSIVTGSYQSASPNPDVACPTIDNLDDKQRPKVVKTTSKATLEEVFPGANSRNLVTAQEKLILYEYGDSAPGETLVFLFGQNIAGYYGTNNVYVDGFIPRLPRSKDSGSVGTITIQAEPAGKIFPQLGQDLTLHIASIQIESERRKTSFRPWGVVNPAAGVNWDMVPSPDERIQARSASRPERQSGLADPNDPNSGCKKVEDKAFLEPKQDLADVKLTTVIVKGQYTIAPLNWTPLIQNPLITDFGFIPSQAHADSLAKQIAVRELRRLDSYAIRMPVPDEWLAADCPGYFRCHLDDAQYEATAVTLIVGDNGGRNEMLLKFQANRIGAAPAVPIPASPPVYVPQSIALPAFPPGSPQNNILQLTLGLSAITGFAGETPDQFYLQGAGGNP
jgi:hypothetical protein